MSKPNSGSMHFVPLLAANLIPVAGVLFMKWEPVAVFVFYILETILIGMINVVKMLVVYFANREVAIRKEEKINTGKATGLMLVPFFIFHYYFFIFVQSVLFFAMTGISMDTFKNPLHIFHNFSLFVNSETSWALGGILLSHALAFSMDFMLNGEFKKVSMARVMTQPYNRIFVQQFAVILGAFALILFSAFLPRAGLVIFIILFSIIKIFLDLKFDKMTAQGGMSFE